MFCNKMYDFNILKNKRSKEAYRKKAKQFLQVGKRTEARECFQRCIDCTPQMALDVIQVNIKDKINTIFFKLIK